MDMTISELAQAQLTAESRVLSNAIFGRDYQLEIAAAAAGLEAGFVTDDLWMETRRRAEDAGLVPPKESAVRTSLARLVSAGALDLLPPSRPGSPGYYSPARESAFWPFALELYART
jgi:hypothetical protein